MTSTKTSRMVRRIFIVHYDSTMNDMDAAPNTRRAQLASNPPDHNRHDSHQTREQEPSGEANEIELVGIQVPLPVDELAVANGHQ